MPRCGLHFPSLLILPADRNRRLIVSKNLESVGSGRAASFDVERVAVRSGPADFRPEGPGGDPGRIIAVHVGPTLWRRVDASDIIGDGDPRSGALGAIGLLPIISACCDPSLDRLGPGKERRTAEASRSRRTP
jgi:hypothetical protein